jgi:hypothetical protein
MARPVDGAPDPADEFLSWPVERQLRFVEELDRGKLADLYNRCVRAGTDGPRVFRNQVHGRMLELLRPRLYAEMEQDADQRLALRPEALERVRTESVRDVAAVAKAPPEKQAALLDGLDDAGLRDLRRRVERYMQVYGWVPLYDAVRERL